MFANDVKTTKLRACRNLMLHMNRRLNEINDRLKSFIDDETKENRPAPATNEASAHAYRNFLPFWKKLDNLDDQIIRNGSSNLTQIEFNLIVNWAKKFISTISQVLLYEAMLSFQTVQNGPIEIVTVQNMNPLADYIPHQRCSEATCRPLVVPSFVYGGTIFLLPFKCGFRRGIVKNNQGNQNVVVYIAPCGAIIQSADYLKRYLADINLPTIADWFTFSVYVEPRRRFVVDPLKVLHRVRDLTDGNELIPIECVNEINYRSIAIDHYLTKSVWYNGYQPQNVTNDIVAGCTCAGDCSSEECICRRKNKDKFIGYDMFGRLSTADCSTVLHECNASCSCQVNYCRNRITQKPRSCLLQVFMTKNKRWGVRSLVDLPKGFFVAIVAGVIITEAIAESYGRRITDEYIFDLPPLSPEIKDEDHLSIECSVKSNVSKLFNHSCDPNMTLHTIIGHDVDRRLPTFALFTSKFVATGTELTFHYNYKVGGIFGRDVKCQCESSKCCGRLL